jgi:hypothetical protein
VGAEAAVEVGMALAATPSADSGSPLALAADGGRGGRDGGAAVAAVADAAAARAFSESDCACIAVPRL